MRRALPVIAAIVVSASWAIPSRAAPAVAAPAPLPATRLEFGLSNLDLSWMTSSGVPWRYRFQYLAGGVNTSGNWLTWQDPSLPPGQFAVDYMNNSTTAPANYIPVFTYYELLQSSPSVGADESTRDYNNLNNASTMNAYYANFKILMQKAGAYGRQAVVHVEPDFWGYMQQRAAGGTASSVSASVSSSGFAEAASFPNTVAGFASALAYLRDTYAPNAVLAMHASMWSSSIDIASDTRSSINAATEADKTAAFLNSAGAASWDAIFNDLDDHNAAWWELASCGSPPCVNQYFTHWWDPTNTRYPNFARYEAWVAELHAKTARPQVAWQVPMGNQYFLTMNNTCDHYQDNVAPYFISHPNELFNAGLIAVLFGAGNSCQTSNEDGAGDGVTNNTGAPTTDALGGCNACNTNASSYPDDDGGYLRIFVGQYYRGCTTAGLTPSVASPSSPGPTITFTATSTGCSSPQYRFFVQPPGGSWTAMTGYVGATWSWSTAGLAPGVYGVGVWARNTSSPLAYESYWLGTYALTLPTCSSASLSTATTSPQAAGANVTYAATAAGCPSAQFRFWLLRPGGSWQMQQDYGAAAWTWSTAGLAPGTYQVGVWARQQGSTSAYDAYGIDTFVIGAGSCTAVRMTPDTAPPAAPGGAVTFTAASNACAAPQYRFWLLPPGGTWTVKQAYGASATWVWSTAGLAPGTYQVGVWVKAGGSARSYDAYFVATYQLVVPTCTAATVSATPASPQNAGTAITFTATATGCPAPQFEFWELAPGSSTWRVVQPYSASVTFAWDSPGSAGNHRFGVWARQNGSGAAYDTYAIVTFFSTG